MPPIALFANDGSLSLPPGRISPPPPRTPFASSLGNSVVGSGETDVVTVTGFGGSEDALLVVVLGAVGVVVVDVLVMVVELELAVVVVLIVVVAGLIVSVVVVFACSALLGPFSPPMSPCSSRLFCSPPLPPSPSSSWPLMDSSLPSFPVPSAKKVWRYP